MLMGWEGRGGEEGRREGVEAEVFGRIQALHTQRKKKGELL